VKVPVIGEQSLHSLQYGFSCRLELTWILFYFTSILKASSESFPEAGFEIEETSIINTSPKVKLCKVSRGILLDGALPRLGLQYHALRFNRLPSGSPFLTAKLPRSILLVIDDVSLVLLLLPSLFPLSSLPSLPLS
jgi:hypothetical protein